MWGVVLAILGLSIPRQGLMMLVCMLATHQFINYLVPSRVGSAFYLWRHSLQSRAGFVMMVRTKEYQWLICWGSQPLSGNLFSKTHHEDVRGHLRVLSFNSIKLDYGFRGWLPWQYRKALHKRVWRPQYWGSPTLLGVLDGDFENGRSKNVEAKLKCFDGDIRSTSIHPKNPSLSPDFCS